MTPYSISSTTRNIVNLSVFLVALSIHPYLLYVLTHILGVSPALANGISILSLVTGLSVLFDRYAWRVASAYIPGFVPDLSGRWIGYISSREAHDPVASDPSKKEVTVDRQIPVEVVIDQTFTSMNLFLWDKEQDGNPSNINSAAVIYDEGGAPCLTYTFQQDKVYGSGALILDRNNRRLSLKGEYISNYPRKGFLKIERLPEASSVFICERIREMQSLAGELYIGAIIEERHIEVFREKLKSVSGEQFSNLRNNQVERDGAVFHMTVFDPGEYKDLRSRHGPDVIEKLFIGRKVWIELVGLGKQQRGPDTTYFVVCASSRCQAIRVDNQLPPKDLHITLGFSAADVHGLPKGTDQLIR